MISPEDRNALIIYRIGQSYECIETVKFLLLNEKLAIAVNRVYYGTNFKEWIQ
jgi:uncharacterized protein (UPF0332 family)